MLPSWPQHWRVGLAKALATKVSRTCKKHFHTSGSVVPLLCGPVFTGQFRAIEIELVVTFVSPTRTFIPKIAPEGQGCPLRNICNGQEYRGAWKVERRLVERLFSLIKSRATGFETYKCSEEVIVICSSWCRIVAQKESKNKCCEMECTVQLKQESEQLNW